MSVEFHEQYNDKWRERLFYQYKLYVDNISRLHAREHMSLTIFIFINGFLMVSTLVSIAAEALVKISWLDVPYAALGSLLSVGFLLYTIYMHKKNKQILSEIKEIEHEPPASLMVLASPTSIIVRVVQDLVPLFFVGAYVYIYLAIHIFNH